MTGSCLCKMKACFLEIPIVCSETIMSYLFSKLRKRGVKMNIKKVVIIC